MNVIGIRGQSQSGKDTVGAMMAEALKGKTIALADPLKEFCRLVFEFSEDQLYGPSQSRNQPDLRYKNEHALERARLNFGSNAGTWLREVLPSGTEKHTPAAEANDWVETRYAGVDADVAYRKLVEWFEDVCVQKEITPRYALQTLGTEWGRDLHEDIWIRFALEKRAPQKLEEGANFVIITDCRFPANECRLISEAKGYVVGLERPGYTGAAALAAGKAEHRSETTLRDDKERAKYDSYTIINDGTLSDLKTKVEVALKSLT